MTDVRTPLSRPVIQKGLKGKICSAQSGAKIWTVAPFSVLFDFAEYFYLFSGNRRRPTNWIKYLYYTSLFCHFKYTSPPLFTYANKQPTRQKHLPNSHFVWSIIYTSPSISHLEAELPDSETETETESQQSLRQVDQYRYCLPFEKTVRNSWLPAIWN